MDLERVLRAFDLSFNSEVETFVHRKTGIPITLWYDAQGEELNLIDQTKLPYELEVWKTKDWREAAINGIKGMIVRGSQAIGCTGAYCMVLAINQFAGKASEGAIEHLFKAAEEIKSTRPTAVNLSWAVDRVFNETKKSIQSGDGTDIHSVVKKAADDIFVEDLLINRELRKNGSEYINDGDVIITHCNAGSLATSYGGSALSILEESYSNGKDIVVVPKETRPRNQGFKLSVWELTRCNIPTIVITDNMVSSSLNTYGVNKILVGADRITKDGAVANKIGTLDLAKISSFSKIPFYVGASYSTLDLSLTGDRIPIEERDWHEMTAFYNYEAKVRRELGDLSTDAQVQWPELKRITDRTKPSHGEVKLFNPAFDVTPPSLISLIILDIGSFSPSEISTLTGDEVSRRITRIVSSKP
ncbi:MAG: S-methyl-5-thioribose-1-phosphate isomerase [Candidatus Hodarchaeota archaeon]